jgi:hypothetical protein
VIDLLIALSLSVVTSYHIGNSLTHDMQPEGLAALSASRGIDHQVGFHIRGSWPLQTILANPDETSIEPNEFGTFAQALPNNAWDIVTFQPHVNNEPPTRLGMDVGSIKTIIDLTRTNPANENTNFYIYQGWPQLSGSYQTAWTKSSPDDLNTPMSRSREYYDHLIERVRAETDANVYMIPTGEVFYELDVRMRAGQIPGFASVNQLYRDSLHLTYGPGRFVAGATAFSTIMGQYPTGLEIPSGVNFYGPPGSLTAEQQAAILETIRDVLDKHSYSGVSLPPPLQADFDNNLVVDDEDREFLMQSLDVTKPYDMDLDGDVDGRDFLAWQRQYRTTVPAEQIAVADLNDDGIINNGDLAHWQEAYGISNAADVDGDGDTDGRDFLAWQRAHPDNIGDTNHDYLVDGSELAEWQASFAFDIHADANGDGNVDNVDLAIWESENGRTWTYPAAISAPPLVSQTSSLSELVVVPEPATVFWLAISGPALLLRRSVRSAAQD